MKAILRWASRVFIVGAIGVVLWSHLNAVVPQTPVIDGIAHGLIIVAVISLPGALAQVIWQSDPASRRRWMVLLGVVGLLVAVTYLVAP